MSKQRFGMMPDGAKDEESKYLHLLREFPRDRSPAFCERFGLRQPTRAHRHDPTRSGCIP